MTIAELRQEQQIACIIADHDGVIQYVSDAFHKMSGYSSEDLVGESVSRIVPEHLRAAHNMGFAQFAKTGNVDIFNKPLKLQLLTKDGKNIDTNQLITVEKEQDNWIFGVEVELI